MLPGETIQSLLPQDIPWWRPDYAVFFTVLYIVVLMLASGVGFVLLRSIWQTVVGKWKH
ncbi:MAG: hypothetical protein K9K39_00085 [Desulfohalobiaceae bacterium]|nr:hypothetical protein [Desulfohalobiaceae bacterium]